MDLDKIIESMKEDIVRDTQELIRIRSVEDKPLPGKPFGEGVNQALEKALEISERLGFKVKNCEGYAGFAEYGEGQDLVGVLVHLDVVPEGDGWTYPPYAAEIHDNKIYGRGAIDNKGPAVACLYALKAIKDLNLPVSKRVRIIFGTNEESGWGCMDYYMSHEEVPSCGFAPDAEFPIIYSEKGILIFKLVKKFEKVLEGDLKLLSVKGGNRANMVPDYCEAVLKLNNNLLDIGKLLDEFKSRNSFKMELVHDGDNIIIKSYGVSAHGSLPEKGKNAISQLIMFLKELPLPADDIKVYIDFLAEKIGMEYDGRSFGLAMEDEISGKLVFNLGVMNLNSEQGVVEINIRYPIKYTEKDVREKVEEEVKGYGITIEDWTDKAPLYVPADHFLVKILKKVYEESTGQEAKLISIGGGTYARAMKNAVAFGPLFPGQEELAHQKDEYIDIDHLILITKIYAKAIYELIK